MHEDRTLFGQGRYPDAGLLAVLARLAFLGAVLGIVIAVFLPPSMVPQLLYSHYLEHFAALVEGWTYGRPPSRRAEDIGYTLIQRVG